MKFPQQVRPEMFERDNQFVRNAAPQTTQQGITPQACGDPGLTCGSCNGGLKWCSEPGRAMPYQCSC